MGDTHASSRSLVRQLIPDFWAPGITKLCKPAPHAHAEGDCGKNAGKRPILKAFNANALKAYEQHARLREGDKPEVYRAVLEARWKEVEGWLDAGYNVGLVPPLGVVCLDCDTAETIDWVAGLIPREVAERVPVQIRGAEKAHLWLRYDPELLELPAKVIRFQAQSPGAAGAAAPTLCLDLRVGGRSQAVVAPSRHLSGLHYEWALGLPEELADLPELPEALARELARLCGLGAPATPLAAAAAIEAADDSIRRVAAAMRPGTVGTSSGGTHDGGVPSGVQSSGPIVAEATAGHDRLRGYVNRLCRYASGADPGAAVGEVRLRAEAFARDLYGGRPDGAQRLGVILREGGELDRLVVSGWERFGARAPLLEDRTDQGYLDTLLATWGDRWRWAVERAQWLEWSPQAGCWTVTFDELIMRKIGGLHAILLEDALREVAQDRRERLIAMSRQLRNVGKVKSVLGRLKAEVAVAERDLDQHGYLLACPGGLVRTAGPDGAAREAWVPAVTLELGHPGASSGAGGVGVLAREPRPEDLITRAMGAPWVPGARSRVWEGFLGDSVPDPELRAFLQRAAGLTAVGEVLRHVFLFLHGPGGTGKSTFLGALTAAMGDYATRCDFRTFAEDPRRAAAGASPDVARLRGARLAVCSEIPDRTHLGARMKDLTGGDRIVARHLYGREIEFAPSHTVWIAGNCAPSAEYADTGVWRRMHQIPFDRVHDPARIDPGLPARLASTGELVGIVAWILEGWVAYTREGGLGESAAVRAATEAFRESMDPLSEWLEECCELRADARVGSGDAWASWQAWVARRGAQGGAGGASVDRKRFAALLRAHGVERVKGPKGSRVFSGLSLIGSDPVGRMVSVQSGMSMPRRQGL